MYSSKNTKYTNSFFGDINYTLNKIKSNSKYYPSKKINLSSSSLEKNIYPITKLAKTPFRKDLKKNNSLNNSLDMNISIYLNKGKSQDNSLHNTLKYPNYISSSSIKLEKKIIPYQSKEYSNKRNKKKNMNEFYESQIINNNLNISLTNFVSPKENNSFVYKPFFMDKSIEDNKNKCKNFSNSCSTSFINNYNHKTKKDLKSNSSKNFKNISCKVNYVSNKNNFIILKNKLNDNIKNIKTNEKNINIINSRIYDIIQIYFSQFANLLQQNEKEVALNLLFHINEIILFKNEEILKLKKLNKELEKKYNDIKTNNDSFINENIELRNKLESVIEKFNNTLNINFSKFESNNKQSQNKSVDEKDTESSVNIDDLESIRFFDKIYMKRNSFSNSNIPNLNLNFSIQNKKQKPINNNSLYNIKNTNKNINKTQYKSKGYSSIAEIKKNYLFNYFKK